MVGESPARRVGLSPRTQEHYCSEGLLVVTPEKLLVSLARPVDGAVECAHCVCESLAAVGFTNALSRTARSYKCSC